MVMENETTGDIILDETINLRRLVGTVNMNAFPNFMFVGLYSVYVKTGSFGFAQQGQL